MIFRNLFRRKGRTILTLVGIGIGVAALVALGAVGQGLRAGFGTMTRSSQADLVLTQANAYSALMSAVDESVADEIGAWGEVAGAEGFLFTNVVLDGSTYLYVFGYEPDGFAIRHFRIVEGQGLAGARGIRGKPLILGRQAAESLRLHVGDSLRFTGGTFRVVGIETGSGLEDRAAVVPLAEAQTLAHQPHLASMIYVKLRDPSLLERVRARIERRFPDLAVSTTSDFADREQIVQIVEGMAAAVAALAVGIGGGGVAKTPFFLGVGRGGVGLLQGGGWGRGGGWG